MAKRTAAVYSPGLRRAVLAQSQTFRDDSFVGMCIVYRAVLPSVGRSAVPEQVFGRRVPLALGPMLADARDRETLRHAAERMDYAHYRRAGAALWGGPPAHVGADGLATLPARVVASIASELRDRDEAWLSAAYAREREHISAVLDQASVVECYALLRTFFTSAAASSSDVVIGWEYR
jgi:hypothetical protein